MQRDDEKVLTQANTNEPKPQPVSDAAGAMVGGAMGAGIGALAGPIGILVGAAAGSLGAGWPTRSATLRSTMTTSTAASTLSYRQYPRYTKCATTPISSLRQQSDYRGKPFEAIEPHLRNTIGPQVPLGQWDDVREYIAEGYRRKNS